MNLTKTCLIDPIIKLTSRHHNKLSKHYKLVTGLNTKIIPNPLAVEGLIIQSKVEQSFIDKLPELKWIGVRANNTATYVPPGTKLKVINIPSIAETAVAEHTFAMILGLSKKLLLSHQNVIRGDWQNGLEPNFELAGKNLGIVGFGTIGKRVEQIAKAFQMNILIASSPRHSKPDQIPLEQVLKYADIVTLHLSSRPENIHFMNSEKFQLMKPGSIFINTSRGNMVDEIALLAALRNKSISGAGLDVFENEPFINSELSQLTNVLLTPHYGYVTKETTERMTDKLIDNILEQVTK